MLRSRLGLSLGLADRCGSGGPREVKRDHRIGNTRCGEDDQFNLRLVELKNPVEYL